MDCLLLAGISEATLVGAFGSSRLSCKASTFRVVDTLTRVEFPCDPSSSFRVSGKDRFLNGRAFL